MDTMRDRRRAEMPDTAMAHPPHTAHPGAGRGRAAAAGILAGAAALGLGELIAACSARWTSPVTAVAEAFVDRVPRPVKDFGIRTFGGDDKTALVVGILVVSVLCAVALGLVSRRHPAWANAGFTAFAGVGVWASQQRAGSDALHAAPSVGAGLAALAALRVLGHGNAPAARRDAPQGADGDGRAPAMVDDGRVHDVVVDEQPVDETPDRATPDRATPDRATHDHTAPDRTAPDRTALDHATPRVVWTGDPDEDANFRANDTMWFSAPASRRRFLVRASVVAAIAAGAAASGRALRSRFSAAGSRRDVVLPPATSALETPLAGIEVPGAAPFFTPNGSFYRVDTAVEVPQVAADGWTLRVTGMVEREVEITFAELARRPLVEQDITLTCVSNTVGGKLVGTARWLGLPLRDLLDEAGIDPTADQVVGRSVDGYTCGFPIAALDGRPALLAIGMNGEPLPIAHGFPARLVIAGLYGYVSATKWITELEVTRFDRFDQYWVERGWDDRAPIKTMSRIDTPRSLTRLQPGPNVIAGVAWAQTVGIARVELSVDDGAWVEAELAVEQTVDTWRQWRLAWDAVPGRHRITVRATDARGRLQTEERAEPFPNGASGWMSIVVDVGEAP